MNRAGLVHPLAATACVAGLLLAACQSNSSSQAASQPVSTPESTPASSSPAMTTSPVTPTTSHARTVQFRITDDSGWTYAGHFQLPDVHLTLGKDISSSPPGEAAIIAHLTVSNASPPPTFSDTNSGRPNGPTITPAYYVAERIPESLISGESHYPGGFGGSNDACQLGGDNEYFPYRGEIDCNIGDGTPGQAGSGDGEDVGAESIVNEIAAAVNQEQPTFIINFDPLALGCNVWVLPDDTVDPRSPALNGLCEDPRTMVRVVG